MARVLYDGLVEWVFNDVLSLFPSSRQSMLCDVDLWLVSFFLFALAIFPLFQIRWWNSSYDFTDGQGCRDFPLLRLWTRARREKAHGNASHDYPFLFDRHEYLGQAFQVGSNQTKSSSLHSSKGIALDFKRCLLPNPSLSLFSLYLVLIPSSCDDESSNLLEPLMSDRISLSTSKYTLLLSPFEALLHPS